MTDVVTSLGAGKGAIVLSAVLHVAVISVIAKVPAPAVEAPVRPVLVELSDPPPPVPPPPLPEVAPSPRPTQPSGPAPTLPVKPTLPSKPAKVPAPMPSPQPLGPAVASAPATAGMAAPGEPGIRALDGEFSGGVEPVEPASGPPPGAQPPQPPPAPAAVPEPCREELAKAKPVDVPVPAYPEAQRESGIAGKVRVRLKLDATGRVVHAEVLEGLGEPFDTAALEAARAATFEPATRCGEAVASTFTLGIRFTP